MSDVVRDKREELMAQIRDQLEQEAQPFGIHVVDVRIRRADLPEQNSQAVYQRMQTERQREAAEFRAQGSQKAQEIRAKADRDVTVLIADANQQVRDRSAVKATPSATASSPMPITRDPDFFGFYRSMQAYETKHAKRRYQSGAAAGPDFFRYFGDPSGKMLPQTAEGPADLPRRRPPPIRSSRVAQRNNSKADRFP